MASPCGDLVGVACVRQALGERGYYAALIITPVTIQGTHSNVIELHRSQNPIVISE